MLSNHVVTCAIALVLVAGHTLGCSETPSGSSRTDATQPGPDAAPDADSTPDGPVAVDSVAVDSVAVDSVAVDSPVPGDSALADSSAPVDGAVVVADEFYCLQGLTSVKNVAQDLISGKSKLADGTPVPDTEIWFATSAHNAIPQGSGVDARGATIVTPTLGWSQEYRKWYPFAVRGGLNDVCVAGGDFLGTLALDIGWHDSKANNSAPVMFAGKNHTVSGAYIFNNHDSVRPCTLDGAMATNWTLAHSWVAYNRDDCIENDATLGDGLVYDSLFDGCYVAYSTRDPTPKDRTGDLITFDKVLLRMEPMPFPYKWWERNLDQHLYVAPYTKPIDNAGHTSSKGIPFGHGLVFKLNIDASSNPRFALKDSVLLLQQMAPGFNQLPPNELIKSCQGLTVVWAGSAPLADFVASFTVPAKCAGEVTFTDDLSVWQKAVADWHARHPNVGSKHKPAVDGSIEIPRWDPQPWP